MKTVLIFAHECVPHHRPQSTIGAQRPAQFAHHLTAFGWRAIVICCAADARETLQLKDLPHIKAQVRTLLQHAAPDAPLIIPTPSLVSDGGLDRVWRATLPARGAGRAPLRRVLTAAKFLTGDWSQSWQPCARVAAEAVWEQVRPDVCLAEHGPDASLFLARWLKRRYGVPWLADFRDPVLRPFHGLARRTYAKVAHHLMAEAWGSIAVTPVWAESDAALFGKPTRCIPNGYEPTEYAVPDPQQRNEFFTWAFAGNIRDSFSIFVEGLRLAQTQLNAEERRVWRFRYWGVAYEKVTAQMTATGLRDNCEIHGHGPRPAVLHALGKADILLLVTLPLTTQSDPLLAQGLYPGKVFECFGVGRPIVCVPSDGGLLDDLLRRSQAGVAFAEPAALASYFVTALRAWRQGVAPAYQPDAAFIAQFTRRNLTQKLAAVLDEVLS